MALRRRPRILQRCLRRPRRMLFGRRLLACPRPRSIFRMPKKSKSRRLRRPHYHRPLLYPTTRGNRKLGKTPQTQKINLDRFLRSRLKLRNPAMCKLAAQLSEFATFSASTIWATSCTRTTETHAAAASATDAAVPKRRSAGFALPVRSPMNRFLLAPTNTR